MYATDGLADIRVYLLNCCIIGLAPNLGGGSSTVGPAGEPRPPDSDIYAMVIRSLGDNWLSSTGITAHQMNTHITELSRIIRNDSFIFISVCYTV